MTFIKRLTQNRKPIAPGAAGEPKGNAAAANVDAGIFAGAQISEKVIGKFGASLQPIAPEMKAIGQVALAMRPHRALQLSHALDRFYGDLGKQLGRISEAARPEVAKHAAQALAKIVDRIGTGERLVPAIETLSSLLFFAKAKERDFGALANNATIGLSEMLDHLEGRAGAGSLLLGFRNLSEVVTKGAVQVDLQTRTALWNEAFRFLLDATPAEGASQGEIGRVVGLYFQAAQELKDPRRALRLATERAQAPFEGSREALLAQLQVEPPVAADAPGRSAHRAITEALHALIERHRVGPLEFFDAVEQLLGRVTELSGQVTAEQEPAFEKLGQLIRMIAGHTSARTVLLHLAHTLPALLNQPEAMRRLVAVETVDQLPIALLTSGAVVVDQGVAEFQAGLNALKRLGPSMGTAVALAVLPQLVGPHGAEVLLATAQFARTAETSEQVGRFATSFAGTFPITLAQLPVEDARDLATALAAELDGRVDHARARFVTQTAVEFKGVLPAVELKKVLKEGRSQEAGLLSFPPQNAQNRAPFAYASRLLRTLAAAAHVPDDTRAALARRAMHVGNELARLDRDPETVMPQVLEDWAAALDDPGLLQAALKVSKKVGVQGQGQASTLGYLEAHPELPAEVALTAGRHLNREQITWFVEQIQNQRSHGKVRQLRDLVFGLVQVKRLDLLEALRTSPADGKAKEAFLTHVVQEIRAGRAPNLPFDALRDGIAAGKDPVAEIRAINNAAALGAIFPAGDGVGALDAAAVEQLKKHQATIQTFLAHFPKGQDFEGQPSSVFSDPLIAWLRAYAEGRIAEHKYESPLADQVLADLTPAARALWASEGVTGNAVVQPAPNGPEQEALRQQIRGLAKSLERVKLTTAEWPAIGFNAESLTLLSQTRDEHLAALRGDEKGSQTHRTRSKALGPVLDRLALIQLKLALDAGSAAEGFAVDPLLRQVQAVLPSAARAVRRLGGASQAELMLELAGTIRPEKPAAREGTYAADEDRLDAYLTSFGGGCINPTTGINRHTLIEAMTNPRYKMCRALVGEQPQARSFLRLMRVEIGAYKGPALWLDVPQATGGGNNGQDKQLLMYRHALGKAVAMGIPFFCNGGHAATVAKERGLEMKAEAVKVTLERGVTGTHHTQYFAPIAGYGVRWPPSTWGHGNKVAAAPDATVELAGQVSVVFPPGLAH